MSLSLLVLWIAIASGAVWVISVALISVGLMKLKLFSEKHKPTVSVLVAARNEEHSIPRLLASLSNQDYPSELCELVVIDDHSEDKTAEVVRKFSSIRLIGSDPISEEIAPKKNAIMTGIRHTSGEIILTTDADCVLHTGWISGMVRQFMPDVGAVVGFSPLTGRGLTGAICRFDGFINAVVSAGTIGIGYPTTAVGRNFAYRRSAWEQVDGFGESAEGASGDDDLLLQRIATDGGKVRFSIDPKTFVSATSQDSVAKWIQMKRRHLSAGTRYKSDMMSLSALLYVFNLVLIASTLLACFGQVHIAVPLVVFGIKAGVDGLTLAIGAQKLKVRNWTFSWVVGEIVSPILIVILVPLSLVGQISWKDRRLNR